MASVVIASAKADEQLHLEWTAPPECPTAAQVLDAIHGILGPERRVMEDALVARATVEPLDGGFMVLRLETEQRGERGQRTIEGHSCTDLADAAALLVALAIDPTAVPPEPAPVAEEPAETEIFERAADIAAPTPVQIIGSEDSSFQPFVEAELLLDSGSLPGIALGLAVDVGFDFGNVGFRVGGCYFGDQPGEGFAHPTASGSVHLWAARVLGFMPFREGSWSFLPRAGFEVGAIEGSGAGVTHPGSGAALWATVIVGTSGRLSLASWVGVELGLEAAFPIHRPLFLIDGVGSLHRPDAVVGRGSVAVVFFF